MVQITRLVPARGMAATAPLADIREKCLILPMIKLALDEGRFDERVKKLVKHKPVEKPE